MSFMPNDEIVRIATAPNPPVAHIWEEALKEQGIRCKVVGDYLDAGLGDLPGIRAEIWVHREDAQKAEEIISHLEAMAAADSTEEVKDV